MSSPRILLCGDVVGRLDQLLKRVATVNKSSGPFDALFCVGQFFSDEDSGHIQEGKDFFLPTYFIGNYGGQAPAMLTSAKAKAKELGQLVGPVPVCSNLFWLKGSGVVTIAGLRVAYLSGKFRPDAYEDAKRAEELGAIHQDDVDALRAVCDEPQIHDFFLTNEWPQGVTSGSNENGPGKAVGVSIIAELAAELKPRYHIAGTQGLFYTREPYSNPNVPHVTRFVALGSVGNDKKQKYLHALSPTPASQMALEELSVKPSNTTVSPYQTLPHANDASKKREADSSELEGQYWRYAGAKRHKRVDGACFDFIAKGSCSRGERCRFRHTFENGTPIPRRTCYDFISKGKCDRGSDCNFHHITEETVGKLVERESGEGKKHTPGPCWFCLSSPEVETHLVVSVGDYCYCALAKGPLDDSHVLLIPIEHLPCTISVSSETSKEIVSYKDALRNMFESQGKAMILFERYTQLRAGTHAHLQVFGVPQAVAPRTAEAFQSAAKQLGFTFVLLASGSQAYEMRRLLDGVNYFFAELPDGSVLAHPCAVGERMPLQFGREVVAKLLDMADEKADWKNCKLSKEEEVKLVENIKKQFETYDPMRM